MDESDRKAIDAIFRALRRGSAQALKKALVANPGVLLREPDEGVSLLGSALSSVGGLSAATLVTPWEAAESKLLSHRVFFDLLVEHGARFHYADDTRPGLALPPLHTASTLPHPCYVRELIALGADPTRTFRGKLPSELVRDRRASQIESLRWRDDEFLRVLEAG